MLDPDRGAIERPIRSEIFGVARFEQHGRSLGEAHAARARLLAPPSSSRVCTTTSRCCARRTATSVLQARSGSTSVRPANGCSTTFTSSSRRSRRFTTACRAATSATCRCCSTRISPDCRASMASRGHSSRTPTAHSTKRCSSHFLSAYQETRELTLRRVVGAADHAARRVDREPAPPVRSASPPTKAARELARSVVRTPRRIGRCRRRRSVRAAPRARRRARLCAAGLQRVHSD